MRKLLTFFAFLIFIGINSNVNAQLSGPKSIPGDYATIAIAITDLNNQGVGGGGVTFNVAAGHTETSSNLVIAFTLNSPTVSNQVVFQKSGVGPNPLITAAPGVSATLDGIIKLSGADYITFDGIDLLDPVSNTGDAMMDWGYALLRASTTDGCQHNVIRNCTVTLQKINTRSLGIFIANEDLAGIVITAANDGGLNSYNRIYGNSISDVDMGIFAKSATSSRDLNNEIGVNGLAPNNITNWGGSQLSATVANGIRCEGQGNLKISNNVVNGGAGTGGSSTVVGIMVTSSGITGTAATYEISHNNITVTTNPTSQGTWGIRALGTADSVFIHDNIVENCTANQNTTTFSALVHDAVGTTNAAFIYNNIVRNNSHSGSGLTTLLGGTAAITYSHIYNNQIYGNQKNGTGTMHCIRAANGFTDCESNVVYDNSFPNTSGTTAVQLYGYRNDDSDPATENVFNNSFYNLSIGGSGTAAASIIAGIRSSSDPLSIKNFYGNNIYGLSTVTGNISGNITGGGVIGIWNSSGTADIHRNKIFDLTNTGTNGTSLGIWASAGTNNQIYNNVISDLNAPNSGNANAVIGINVSSTAANTAAGVYDNSIYLTAAGGATFGSSGVSVTASATATTATLDMRNNNIINLSAPGTTSGNTVAYRRSTTSLANYALTSDFNNYYAGGPAANRLIFFDGTNSDQTLAAYQARVAPRDANSTTISSKTLTLTINFEACAVTDTITVELRKADPPFNPLEVSTALGGQGISRVVNFEQPVDGVNYYIVVKHRNSIETWSKLGGEEFSAGTLSYDFTTAASQAFGSNMVNVGGEWSLYTGDVNQDGIVDLSDLALIDNDAFNFVTGYVSTDLNCDGLVDLTDAAFADNNGLNFVAVVKP